MPEVSSLSRFYAWQGVADLLELDRTRRTLPANLRCPACQAHQLYVYRDDNFGGEWVHCRHCDYHGDIVELAATTWKLDLWHAAVKLASFPQACTVSPVPTDHLPKYLPLVERRQQVDKFWQLARTQLGTVEDNNLRDILNKFGIHRSLAAADWKRTSGKFVGVATREQVEQHFKTRSHHRHNILKGQGWKHVLCVPYYDLPGRIVGFLFIGRQGRTQDMVYHRIYPNIVNDAIGMLPALLGKTPKNVTNEVFHFTDPQAAIRLQMRWLRSNQYFLPIVLSQPGSSVRSWRSMSARQHTICAPKLTSDVIRKARELQGRVAVFRPPSNDYERPPTYWLKRASREASLWRNQLERQLRQVSVEEGETILLELGLQRAELVEFIKSCERSLRVKLERLLSEQSTYHEIHYRRYRIIETIDGWTFRKAQICNGRVHVDTILKVNNKTYYKISIRAGRQELSLLEDASTVRRKGLFRCAMDYAADQGVALVYDERWNKRALQLAMLRKTPTILNSPGRIGWDPALNGFRLQHFNLVGGGETCRDTGTVYADPRLPTRLLLPPGPVLERTIQALTKRSRAAELFWATFCGVMGHILAPALQTKARPLAFRGRAATLQGLEIAGHLGCELYTSNHPVTLQRATQHHWPAVLSLSADLGFKLDWLKTASNCLGELSSSVLPLAVIAGWDQLTVPDDSLPLQVSPNELQTILPRYLQDLCRRNLALTQAGAGFAGIVEDVAAWVDRTWGLRIPETGILRAYTAGDATTRATAFRQLLKDAGVETKHGDGHLLLSQTRTCQTNYPLGYVPDVYDTTLLLDAAGVLCPDVEQSGYWAVQPTWWQT